MKKVLFRKIKNRGSSRMAVPFFSNVKNEKIFRKKHTSPVYSPEPAGLQFHLIKNMKQKNMMKNVNFAVSGIIQYSPSLLACRSSASF